MGTCDAFHARQNAALGGRGRSRISDGCACDSRVKVSIAVVAVLLMGGYPGVDVSAQSTAPPVANVAEALPPTIPLFPLEDVMLFPNISRQFHIFEPRYKAMIADALDGDRIIGMVLAEPGPDGTLAGTPPIYAIGCAGVIADVEMFPDGRYNIVLKGLTKFRILGETEDEPYRLADVVALPESIAETERASLRARRTELANAFAARVPEAAPPPAEMADEDFVNGLAQFFPLDAQDRQRLLEEEGPLARARALLELMESPERP